MNAKQTADKVPLVLTSLLTILGREAYTFNCRLHSTRNAKRIHMSVPFTAIEVERKDPSKRVTNSLLFHKSESWSQEQGLWTNSLCFYMFDRTQKGTVAAKNLKRIKLPECQHSIGFLIEDYYSQEE